MRYKVFILSLITLISCEKSTQNESGKPYLVATTGMIADALVNLMGPYAEVESLMGPGVDPHLFKATQGDLARLTNADMIFYNGLHLEGKMGDIFENMKGRKPVVAVAEEIDKNKLRKVAAFNNNYDPHVWFDVQLWLQAVNTMATALKGKFPELVAEIDKNRDAYIYNLKKLDTWVFEQIQTIPQSQRVLITAHDAFGYFGIAYGIEVMGLQGISTLSEPGLRDVSNLVTLIGERKIKAVFVETSVSERSINAVIEGCSKNGFEVKNGGFLFSDAMGAKGTEEGTYIGMVKSNVHTIVNALK